VFFSPSGESKIQNSKFIPSAANKATRQHNMRQHPFKSFSNPFIRVLLAEWRIQNPKSKIQNSFHLRPTKQRVSTICASILLNPF
jgi:hypothetical protein